LWVVGPEAYPPEACIRLWPHRARSLVLSWATSRQTPCGVSVVGSRARSSTAIPAFGWWVVPAMAGSRSWSWTRMASLHFGYARVPSVAIPGLSTFCLPRTVKGLRIHGRTGLRAPSLGLELTAGGGSRDSLWPGSADADLPGFRAAYLRFHAGRVRRRERSGEALDSRPAVSGPLTGRLEKNTYGESSQCQGRHRGRHHVESQDVRDRTVSGRG
jgi:hypothetical protein